MNISSFPSNQSINSWQQFLNEAKAARRRNTGLGIHSKRNVGYTNIVSTHRLPTVKENTYVPSIGKKYESMAAHQPIKRVGHHIDAYA